MPLRERLGYSLYRDMDVLAPRAVHARVYINGEYQGLFVAVEEIDGRFAPNRFPEATSGSSSMASAICAHWQASIAALLADVPKFQSNVRSIMSGPVAE